MGVVNLIDMYPTLVDLCGLPANPENEGRSLLNLFLVQIWSGVNQRYRTINLAGIESMTAVIATVFSKSGTVQLYDHKTDPMEWCNLVKDPEYKEIKERLKE